MMVDSPPAHLGNGHAGARETEERERWHAEVGVLAQCTVLRVWVAWLVSVFAPISLFLLFPFLCVEGGVRC
jgi:hypothetical protein